MRRRGLLLRRLRHGTASASRPRTGPPRGRPVRGWVGAMSPGTLAVEKGWATWFSMSAQLYRVSGDGLQVSIGVSSPSDFDHEDDENAVVDPVGDPESSDPQPIQALVAGQLLHVQARGI